VNVPAIAAEDADVLAPFVSLCRGLGKIAIATTEGSSIDRVRVEFLGRIAERDTRLLSIHALIGVLSGHVEEEVGVVNAPSIAAERGIELVETKSSTAYDYSDLVRVSIDSGTNSVRAAGTLHGARHRPHLLEVWDQRFDVQLENQITVLRYRDVPGMIGRVGTCFGKHGINIVSAAAGRDPDDSLKDSARLQVLVVTTDAPVPHEVIDEIVAGDGFEAGQTVSL
jgi:D-3-phosphoglycerate dehydrogenase